MLQKHGARFNTLTCVNRFNDSRPLDVYRFLQREVGSAYLQLIRRPLCNPEYRLGNVTQESPGDMVFAPEQVRFDYARPESLPDYCRQCECLTDCWRECP